MPETRREVSGLFVLIAVVVLLVAGGLYRYYRSGLFGALGGRGIVADDFDGGAKYAIHGKTEESATTKGKDNAGEDVKREEDPQRIVVHVVGAVAHPGVYEVKDGQRVADAVAVAGGATANSRLDLINLAAPLHDGVKIYIPSEEDARRYPAPSLSGQAGDSVGAMGEGKVVLNSATVAELDRLPGIGPALAKRIVDFREKNGPFERLEDLQQVPGIGPAKFQEMREMMTLN